MGFFAPAAAARNKWCDLSRWQRTRQGHPRERIRVIRGAVTSCQQQHSCSAHSPVHHVHDAWWKNDTKK